VNAQEQDIISINTAESSTQNAKFII